MPYTYDNIFAKDPDNPANVAKSASITIYDPADPAKAPIAITDPTGSPLPNPITVDSFGMGPAFQHPTLHRVGWFGAGFTNYFTSYEGMYNETLDAKAAAQAAAATAGAEAAVAVDAAVAAVIADADAAANSASTAASNASVSAASASAAATAAANSAALVGAPADAAVQTLITSPGSATATALSAAYVGLVQAAKNPDMLIAGAVTVDGSDLVTSAAVLWPDGSPGTLTITARHATGAVSNYNITYGSPVTKTFTQPTITRNANGAATNVPQIVVS